MRLPGGERYYNAIQHPRSAFKDAELRFCIVEQEPGLFGMSGPKPYSGGFTTTYHLYNGAHHWAVRCFLRDVPELQLRYDALSTYLPRSSFRGFVDATFVRDGIQVDSDWFPVIKMEWVEGQPLNQHIRTLINQDISVAPLVGEFTEVVNQLEGLGFAHGDLQHGNIIVKNQRMYLIDYDGFYIPQILHLGTGEIGHISYQHPGRNNSHYGPSIDRFSAITIYLGLRAITLAPMLWSRYDNGDNILFVQRDFIDPGNSRLLGDLCGIPSLKTLAERFATICRVPFENIPSLDEFLSGDFYQEITKKEPGPQYQQRIQYQVIQARDITALLSRVGMRVEVRGRITDWNEGFTHYNTPYMFLNFGKYPNQTLTLVLWNEVLNEFLQIGLDLMSFVGKEVSIIGEIGIYKYKPQIVISSSSQIRLGYDAADSSTELAAVSRLRIATAQPLAENRLLPSTTKSVAAGHSPQPADMHTQHEADILNRLYTDSTVGATDAAVRHQSSPAITSTPVTQQATPLQQTTVKKSLERLLIKLGLRRP